MLTYSLYDLLFYMLLYGFFGWVIEVCYYSVRDKHFVNRGLINLPIRVPCGISFALLILVLPSMGRNYLFQFIASAIVIAVVQSLTGLFSRQVSRMARLETENAFTGSGRNWLDMAVRAAVVLLVYYVVHPVLLAVVSLVPKPLLHVIVWCGMAFLVLDFIMMLYAVRHRALPATEGKTRENTQRIADRITRHIWKRLDKAYPGIEETEADKEAGAGIVFAKGICWDKIIWVFLISALLGDIIETFYCGLMNGKWMNRSSVLYGPFSFVWGIGAVVLTVTLQHMMERPFWYIFLCGFFIGGTYEYLCSVFTEMVFGTVFWDYSSMPLNIGGRTNVMFCVFWGILAVVWVKMLYPALSRRIEQIPPLAGKIITWIVVFFMACNGLLTAGAMVRYNTRISRPEPNGMMEEFLDSQYDDEFMEKRWPNMRVR